MEIDDDELGTILMNEVSPRLERTPGAIRHAGRALGADNAAVFVERLGHSREELERWRSDGVV